MDHPEKTRSPFDPTIYRMWGNAFPNLHIEQGTAKPREHKPAPPRIKKDGDYYRALSLDYASGEFERRRKRTPKKRDIRRAFRRRRR